MNKQQLAQKIWASANQMRSKIEANEYKDYILGFIFYKYLSDKEVSFLKENDYNDEYMKTVTEDDPETVKWVQENIGYFISYENLFSTWLELGRDFDVSNVRDALSAFSRLISNTHKRVFDKVFDTLQTGLSKLGDSSGTQTKAISGLLQLIKDIPMDGKQGYDVLGFIYEYLISMFAANAGKKAGEFYTPHEVSLLMSEIVASHLKGKNEIKIYDPTSGSGSLLINIGQSVAKYMSDSDNIKYYAQELKENTYNLTRMNLVMRGIKPDNIVTRNGDTLEEDWPFFDETMDFHHQLKGAILDAVDEGLIERDPTRKAIIKGKTPAVKKIKYLNQFELHNLLASLDLKDKVNWDYFILLVAKTGMRFSEALALTPNDFDFAHQTLSINKTWDYKGKSGFQPTKNRSSVRKIQIDWQTVIQFSELIKHLPEDKPIFVDGAVYNSTVNNILARHCKECNIPVISIHGLRHTHASLLLFTGVSIASVARRLGHSSMTTTQKTYLHIIQELENKDIDLVMRSLSSLS